MQNELGQFNIESCYVKRDVISKKPLMIISKNNGDASIVSKIIELDIEELSEVLNGKVDKLVKVIEYLTGNKTVTEPVKVETVVKAVPEVVVKEKKTVKKVSKKK